MTEEMSGYTGPESILKPKNKDIEDTSDDEEEEVYAEIVNLNGNSGSDEDIGEKMMMLQTKGNT